VNCLRFAAGAPSVLNGLQRGRDRKIHPARLVGSEVARNAAKSPRSAKRWPASAANLHWMTAHDDRRSSRGTGLRRPLCPARHPPQSVAACPSVAAWRILSPRGTKSREVIYGASVRAAAERAREARKKADRLTCKAWNKRMLAIKGPAQPSPTLGDAINAGFGCLEVRCLGCDTNQTVALDIVRRPKTTPIYEPAARDQAAAPGSMFKTIRTISRQSAPSASASSMRR
jgi:hypothetical protein